MISEQYQWNLKDIFENEQEFEEEIKHLYEKLEKIGQYRGILKNSSTRLFECYSLYEKATEHYEKIYAYGMLKYHLDMANSENIKIFKKCESISADFERKTSFITPEITNIDTNILLKYLDQNENLRRYEKQIKEIIREKKHILTDKEEEILANYVEVFSNMENTFDVLTNTEFKFGTLKDENGEEVQLTDSNYTKYLKSKYENVRKQAFELMYKKYKEFLNTIAELYLAEVKQDTITAKIRNYSSSLEKAVENDDSNLKVYNSLIEAVHEKINVNHEYISFKKKLLNKDEMHIYDIYVNPLETTDDNISFEEAKEEVIKALSILGDEYISKIKEAFENRWVDVFPKENKRGGAYSMGVYGVHPYILDNFVNNKRDISTIAHELGHSMHSYYSDTNQNVFNANYTIMVAEIASTTNEILLAKYQIEKEEDKTKKAEIIYELIEMIRATLFRQTMFAEFEKKVHEKIEQKQILSSEDLSKIYYKLNEEYFGNECILDEEIKYEWARIPHFYSCFYVYKYSTGITSAIVIASKILSGEKDYVQKYINMLSEGGSKDSLSLLKSVEVDLEDPNTYEIAFEYFRKNLNELKNLIKN